MRIVIWGTGGLAKLFIDRKGLYKNDKIVAFVDNNPLLWGKSFLNKPILRPRELSRVEYDQVIICASDDTHIRQQLINLLWVSEFKIKSIKEIDRYYTSKIIEKYKGSGDADIQKAISYYKENGLSIFGDYSPGLTEYEVHRDEGGHPFVIYDEKRIYYPDSYPFLERDNKEYLSDIMYEQKENSPHLYIKDNEYDLIPSGASVVDAGCCEGNFAIRFVDRVSKLYLVEPDPIWVECLKKTFHPFRDKVVICDKALARYDSGATVTLDSLLRGQKIDYLKMDIEGAEVDALLGAQDTLLKNNVNCSICSYHKMNDEKNIRFILGSLGYQTEVSGGYMFYMYDENIYESLDLRRGIVYAHKGNAF